MSQQTKLELLPAVDIVDGHVVMLHQGEAGSETVYGNPVEAALQWQEQGAEWLHLVDLDAAFGRGSNREAVSRIVNELNIKVELSGGLRDDASLENALELGATRVNIGTAALENPEWTAQIIEKFGDRIAISLDVRGEKLSGRGWTSEGGDIWGNHRTLGGRRLRPVRGDRRDPRRDPAGAEHRLADQSLPAHQQARGGLRRHFQFGGHPSAQGPGSCRRGRAIIGKALYEKKFTLPEAPQIANRCSR